MHVGASLQMRMTLDELWPKRVPDLPIKTKREAVILASIVEKETGIAAERGQAKVTLLKVADKPGVAASIFGPLADSGVNVDMIVQNISEEGRTDMTFSCPVGQVARAEAAMEKVAAHVPGARLELIEGYGHDLPLQLCARFVDLVAGHIEQVEAGQVAAE